MGYRIAILSQAVLGNLPARLSFPRHRETTTCNRYRSRISRCPLELQVPEALPKEFLLQENFPAQMLRMHRVTETPHGLFTGPWVAQMQVQPRLAPHTDLLAPRTCIPNSSHAALQRSNARSSSVEVQVGLACTNNDLIVSP